MDQIRLREPRFHEHAYLFILSALEFSQSRLPERRHITGRELAEACRDLALDRYGVMARLVLDHWGVRSTSDIGDVVFTLVGHGSSDQSAHGLAPGFRRRFRLRSGVRARLSLEARRPSVASATGAVADTPPLPATPQCEVMEDR